jgi:hypothetical protein
MIAGYDIITPLTMDTLKRNFIMIRTIELAFNERIIAIVPEICDGSGWYNKIVNVYIVSSTGNFREEILQLDEITDEMKTIFNIADTVNKSLLAALPVSKAKRNQSQ